MMNASRTTATNVETCHSCMTLYPGCSISHQKYKEEISSVFREPPDSWLDLYRAWPRIVIGGQQDGADNTVTPDSLLQLGDGGTFAVKRITNPMTLKGLANLVKSQCVFFIRQSFSHSPLSISHDLFEGLLSEFSIPCNIKDFALSFGAKNDEDSICPPPCRIHVEHDEVDLKIIECTYGLRYAELSHHTPSFPWSVRQSAIYSKYDGQRQRATHVIIAVSERAETRLLNLVQDCATPELQDFFKLHLILVDTALDNWRWYIQFLQEKVEGQLKRVLLEDLTSSWKEAGSFMPQSLSPSFDDRQRLIYLEHKILDLQLAVNASIDTVSRLADASKSLGYSAGAQQRSDWISLAFEEKLQIISQHRDNADMLHKKIQALSTTLSDLLTYEKNQEARQDSSAIRALTESGTRDATAVKTLTAVTLLYLAPTLVATFFSSQFVSLIEAENMSGRIVFSRNSWVFPAVAVPLTVLTFVAWQLWTRYQIGSINGQQKLKKS